jgi:hypothetical protein
MKFNSCVVALFSLNACLFAPNTVQALKCGSAITKDCIGDNDVRYDEDKSNNLVDQADVWKILPGLYISDAYLYDFNGEPIKQNENGFLNFPHKAFTNITVDGTRFYLHQYSVTENALFGIGACFYSDVWYTSTFEKDGSAQVLGSRSGFDNNTVFEFANSNLKLYPVNDRTVYGSGNTPTSGEFFQLSFTCGDEKCSTLLYSAENFYTLENGQPALAAFGRMLNSTKVEEEDYIATMDAFLDDFNVPFSNSTFSPFAPYIRPGDITMAECASGVCPSEVDWQTNDPNFNESPYQEPDASLTAGFIAGITIASFVIVAAIAYMYHLYIVHEREQRLRISFARAVAATIDNRTTAQNLSPEDLKNEFDSIDADKDGAVSKDELRTFIANGNVATISDKDFDVLFATIDLDGNASLDFTEFCAFFAYIRGEFDAAVSSKSVRNMRKSTMKLTTSGDA